MSSADRTSGVVVELRAGLAGDPGQRDVLIGFMNAIGGRGDGTLMGGDESGFSQGN